MLATLRAGRIGPLTIYLNYTWIFVLVLITWWVGLFWLPESHPDITPGWGWLVAIAVALLFLVSVVIHEFVHNILARNGRRNVNLYPFGAAVPFRFRDVPAGRALASVAGAVGFNFLFGAVLLWLGNSIPASWHFLSWLGAILIPLGTLNIFVGLINLIPGVPFDGGWALAAAVYLLSNDKDTGLALARRIGWFAALALIFVGLWQGLTNNSWPQALGLVLAGWAAAEAAIVGQQRSSLREVLSEMTAGEFMDSIPESTSLEENATVAAMMKSYGTLPPNKPIPVLDSGGTLVGITSSGKAETLLQGTWSGTPVRSITIPLAESHSLSASASLVDVLAILEARPAERDDMPDIPVIEDDKLLGSINPDKLRSFEDAGRKFGLQEALGAATENSRRSRFSALGTFLAVGLLLVVAIILGNGVISAQADTTDGNVTSPVSTIVFSNFVPADGQIVGLGQVDISAQVAAAHDIVTATLSVDGEILDVQLTGSSLLAQTVTATSKGLTLGPHTVRVTATTSSGEKANKQWQFRVLAGGNATPTEEPSTGGGTGSGTVVTETVNIVGRQPALGARLQADGDNVAIRLTIESAHPQSAKVTLDGQSLDAQIAPVDGADGTFAVTAAGPTVQAGTHEVHVVVIGSAGGTYSYQWTFSALQPDDNNAFFAETGYFVSQPFLKYWQENGGLGLFGFPISDLIQETDKVTGETYTAQYFERARFELHPSLGNQVLQGRLGAIIAQSEPPAQPQSDAQFFPETGHNLSGTFRKFWNDNGGLAVFGFPITEAHTEKNEIDGKEYTVQYFERARFELHPEMAGTPFEVQLGLLGVQVYNQLHSGSQP